MTTDSRYLNTVPPGLEGDMQDPSRPPTAPPPSSTDYSLVAAVGGQVDPPLNVVKHALHAWVESGAIAPGLAKPVEDALAELHRLSQNCQLLARVAEGRWQQAHAQLNLDSVVKRALDERAALMHHRGVELHRSIKPVAVLVDFDLVTSLVMAAVEYAARPGTRLFVLLDVKNWPAHALLSFKTTRAVVVAGKPDHTHDEPDALNWQLVTEIAYAMGVTVQTTVTADEHTFTLEFPRTVKQLEGLTALEMDAGSESWISTPSQALAGQRVLVITGEAPLREDVKSICRALGLMFDSVPTSAAAIRYCELEQPHLIIVDERIRNDQFNQLRADLLKAEPNFPFIEIGYDSGTLSIASWVSGNMTRVTRSELATQLPQALTLEFAKVL
ncbi:MAG: hypothetical protein IPO43_07350 [Rhodoferax sp.]|nr:hypothetical protein [Rhodoferax sp.]